MAETPFYHSLLEFSCALAWPTHPYTTGLDEGDGRFLVCAVSRMLCRGITPDSDQR